METKDVNKKEFPSFDDLFGDIKIDGKVEEMQISDIGYEIEEEPSELPLS